MPFFWKPYKSDVTQFIEELKARKPTLEDEQRAGRALLWDRRIDREAQADWREARVPQQPYVYQPAPTQAPAPAASAAPAGPADPAPR
jgi:hypothetical protein